MLRFQDLEVWQKSMTLAEKVYLETSKFPQTERFGLTAQIRRCAVSIASNIAEGKAVGGQGYVRHLKIALGSEAELHTQIELAMRVKLMDPSSANCLLEQLAEVGRMLVRLLNSLPRN